MAENTKIEWCDFTFNPVRGCTKVSAGCANCYADTMSKRNPLTLGVWGPNGTRVVASEAMWKDPVKWDRMARDGVCYHCHGKSTRDTPGKCPVCDGKGNIGPHRSRVFCASLADVFEDWHGPMRNAAGQPMFARPNGEWAIPPMVPGEQWRHLDMQDVRRRLFELIDATPNLDWLLLTKRPENIAKMMPLAEWGKGHGKFPDVPARHNVWLGTSVENQAAADERIPHLLRVPAAVRFLSCEPLLGPVGLSEYLRCESCLSPQTCWCADARVNWVIVGGESGPGARPCRVEWIRGIVEQCKAAGVPCFVKQMGSFVVDRNDRGFDAESEVFADGPNAGQPTDSQAWPNAWMDVEHNINGFREEYQGADCRVHLRDKKGGDMTEWPADLRVREFPEAKGTVPA